MGLMSHRSQRILPWAPLRLQRRHSFQCKLPCSLWKRRWNHSWKRSRMSRNCKRRTGSPGHCIRLFRRLRDYSSRFQKGMDHSLWGMYYRFLSHCRFHLRRWCRDHNPLHRRGSFQWLDYRCHLHRSVPVRRRYIWFHSSPRWRGRHNWHQIPCHNKRNHRHRYNRYSLDHCTRLGLELWVRNRTEGYFRFHRSRSPGDRWYRSQWGRRRRCHKSRTLHSHPDRLRKFPQTHKHCSRNL